MWVFTPEGFYSVVSYDTADFKKHGPGPTIDPKGAPVVVVRSRWEVDLLRLVSRASGLGILPIEPVTRTEGADYLWRVWFTQTDWMELVSTMAADVDYTNFKNSVEEAPKERRLSAYHGVWNALYQSQERPHVSRWEDDRVLPIHDGQVRNLYKVEEGLPPMSHHDLMTRGDPFEVIDENDPLALEEALRRQAAEEAQQEETRKAQPKTRKTRKKGTQR